MNRSLKIPGFTWVVLGRFVDIGQFSVSKLDYFVIYVVVLTLSVHNLKSISD